MNNIFTNIQFMIRFITRDTRPFKILMVWVYSVISSKLSRLACNFLKDKKNLVLHQSSSNVKAAIQVITHSWKYKSNRNLPLSKTPTRHAQRMWNRWQWIGRLCKKVLSLWEGTDYRDCSSVVLLCLSQCQEGFTHHLLVFILHNHPLISLHTNNLWIWYSIIKISFKSNKFTAAW